MRETLSNSTRRSLTLLGAVIRDEGRSSLSAIAREVQLPVATAHRLAAALVSSGFLQPGEYGRHLPGAQLRALAPLLEDRRIMASAAGPVLERFAARTGYVAQLGVFEADMVTYLVKAGQSADALFTKVGMQLEAYCSGIGKVLLAHLPAAEQSRYLAGGPFVALTERTITDPGWLGDALHQIAAQGFAIDNEEVIAGLQCLAVPIVTDRGDVIAAISTSRPARGDLERWQRSTVPRLQAAASAIGSKIGSRRGERDQAD